MYKTCLAATIAAATLIAFSVSAQDTSAAQGAYQPDQPVGSGNWFLDANVGRTNGNGDQHFGNFSNFDFAQGQRDRRTGYGLTGGYRWKVGPDVGLGVEAGYADLGNFRVRNIFNSQPVNQSSSVNALRGWIVGLNGRINLLPGWYLSAHGGYFHPNNYDHAYPYEMGGNLGTLTTGRAGQDSWYAGAGTGWDISEHFGIGLQYDYFHANAGKVIDPATGVATADLKRSTGIVSLMGEYRF
ncbi:porin family protein [Dyella jejuensis]|uniref:Porin family protein n=1 Tax=Dyella jejuensis TaxID=1432009 RepID=A0ABW8JI41_9GAMM